MIKGYIYSQKTFFGDDEIIGFGSIEFSIKKIDRGKANNIIMNNHYSKKFYNASTIHLGVYTNNKLIGVLQYGYAMNPVSMDSVVSLTKKDEYLELNRMWFIDNSPKNSKSKAISYSIKYIKRKYPKIAWIQSFADERCHKFGIVYQSANFKYYGEHTSIFWKIEGVYYHNSLMTRNPNLTPSAKYVQDNKDKATRCVYRQFRYLYFIKKSFQSRCLLKETPYLKYYKGD